MDLLLNPAFWVGLCFGLFLLLLIYKKVPATIIAALDKRADLILSELDEARRLREEAQALLADYERKQRGAEKEAESIINTGQTRSRGAGC